MMLGIIWMFQFIAFILVGLRLYTRLVVVHNYGIDDHFFNFAVVSAADLFNLHSVNRSSLYHYRLVVASRHMRWP